jgi:hypothetical protein
MNSRMSRRIFIGPGRHGYLGGRPPQGIEPRSVENRFFATILVGEESDSWVSIFVVREFWSLATSLKLDRVVPLPSTIELIEHSGTPVRSRAKRFAAEISAHSLDLSPPSPDLVEGQPLMESKLGGAPYFFPMSERVEADLADCREHGFEHLLQFSFGGGVGDELVTGSWPLGDRCTSFFRRKGAKAEWRIFWRGL